MDDGNLAKRQFALFVSAVRTMRTAQKLYFKTRTQNDLVLSKGYERRVDALLQALEPPQDVFTLALREDAPTTSDEPQE